MSLRYYPISKVKVNKNTKGGEFLLDGQDYQGKYYETFDGKFFTGSNPIIGTNKRLFRARKYNSDYLNNNAMSEGMKRNLALANKSKSEYAIIEDNLIPGVAIPAPKFKGEPTTHFPVILPEDYTKGSINRYFAKRVNSNGYVIEISEEEYVAIKNGKVPYDVSNYLTTKILWKITGPLNQKRYSQYDIRAGIIDTNKRLVENAEKTFLGLVAYIGGDYSKYAKPTE